MNKLTINAMSYEVDGTNVMTINRKVFVNGKLIHTLTDEEMKETVHIKWEGDLAKLDCTSCEITGSVKGNVDCTSIKVGGNVGGSVESTSAEIGGSVGGSVDSTTLEVKGDINGDVDANSVVCSAVSGSIDAMNVQVRR